MISLVIPVYNEEQLIDRLLDRACQALGSIADDFEIICIDDGSTDASLEKLISYRQQEKRVKIVVLSKNFGHQAAYTAGLTYAKGGYIAMIDADLQDPPELLTNMYEKLVRENLDVVYGKRTVRQERWLKRLSIRLFHKAFRHVIQVKDADNVGNFSLFTRRVLHALLALPEKNRYLPGLRFFVGFKQDYIEYERPDRVGGPSKMSTFELIRLALDAFFSFSDLPIKICLYTGLAGILIFCTGFVYTLVSKFIGIAPFGWSSTIFSIYFLGSVQLVFLGILGEYIHRIYKEIQNRPIFIVREFIE